MTKQHQTIGSQEEKQKRPARDPRVVNEQTLDPIAAIGLLDGQLRSGDAPSMEAQASFLDDHRMGIAQRQARAAQIGRVGGNRYLQRLLGLGDTQRDAATHAPPELTPGYHRLSPGEVTERSFPNGQRQRVHRMHFTQVIARAPSGDEETGAEQEEPITVSEVAPTEEPVTPAEDNTISSTFTHAPTVTRGGIAPGGNFGITGSRFRFTNVNIDPSAGTLIGSGVYTVTGDLTQTINWEVQSGTGPGSEVDIAGDSDPDIKACNYQLVSSDLTPNMGSDNGRPPRTKYWSQDLTERHELFHTTQRSDHWGPDTLTAAQTWLNGQTATSASQIRSSLLQRALNEGIRVFNTFATAPAAEGDTYGDGAPLYLARANAIKTKGDTGDYGKVSVNVTVHPKGGTPYEIVEGDTLWAIAERTYGHGRFWRDIHRANPGKARRGGNLIFPGQIFDLPAINVDQEVFAILMSDTKVAITDTVLVTGGGSHEFLVSASDLFTDTTNCTGDISVDVYDPSVNTLVNGVWSLPGPVTSTNGSYEVTTQIVP